MLIGINASAALKENPTGVEEYVFQLIRHLAMIPESRVHRFVLYLNPRFNSGRLKELEALPDNFEIKFLTFPFLWTQLRLAWEMMSAEIDVLFIPVHILPLIHPKNSVVALHGLEYEYFPELYPFWHRKYLRWSTRYALKNAAKIIAVSENTKEDLVKLYGGDPDKISVVYHGISMNHESRIMDHGKLQNTHLSLRGDRPASTSASLGGQGDAAISSSDIDLLQPTNYNLQPVHILYIGRIELKKNILGIVDAYNKFRGINSERRTKLILAGGRGFGWEKIAQAISASEYKDDIIFKGYVSEEEKNELLKNSAVFLFPSFYEGFGLPVLEAQAAGVPVIASNTSCLPEIAGSGAMLVDPKNSFEIAGAMEKILSSNELRQSLIEAGRENVRRFSWEKCARETLKALTE